MEWIEQLLLGEHGQILQHVPTVLGRAMTDINVMLSDKRPLGLAVSLRTLLFATFIAACIARWLARYGIGLSVALAWCGAAGATVGALCGAISFTLSSFRRTRNSTTTADLRMFLACLTAGGIAGLLSGTVAFVALPAFIDGGDLHVSINGVSVIAVVDRARAPTAQRDVSRDLLFIMLVGSLGGAAANSLACTLHKLRTSPWGYITRVSTATGVVFGLVPVILLVGFIVSLPAKTGLEHEWYGLWPLAAVLYFAMFACIGVAWGAFTGALWIWTWHAQTSRTSWILLWFTAVWVTLFITEAGLRR